MRIFTLAFISVIGLASALLAQPGRPTRSQPTRPQEIPQRPQEAPSGASTTGVTPTSFSATKIKKIDHHSSSIFDLAATPNGKLLLSVGTDGKVFLYNTADWSKLAEANDPEKKSLGVRVSPDGNYAFTASDPSETLIYKLPELTLLHRLKLDMARTTNISCSSRFPLLAVAGAGPFSIVSYLKGTVMRDVPAFETRSRVLWSPNGETLYIVGDTKSGEAYELHKWTMRSGKTERICSTPGEPYEMKWGKNEKELCLTGGEHALVINVDTGKVIEQWKSPDEHIVNDFLYWPRHDVYLSGTKAGNVYFWKHGDKTPLSTFQATTTQVHQIVPIGDDKLATALQQSGNSLAIFQLTWTKPDLASVDPITPPDPTTPDPTTPPSVDQPTDPPASTESDVAAAKELTPISSFLVDTPFSRTLAFNSNNTVLAVALAQGGMAFFNPKTGKETAPRLDSGDAGQYVSLVEPHESSGLFLLHESNAYMSFYDWKNKKRSRSKGFSGLTGCVAWSPDRKYFFVGTQAGFDAGVFDLSRSHPMMTSEGISSIYGATGRGVAVGPKNVVAMVRNDGHVQWFQHANELQWKHDSLVKAHSGGGADIRFIGGQYASIGKEGELKFWQQGDETPSRTVSLHGKLRDARFLSDSLIAIARDEQPILELHTFDKDGVKTELKATIPFDANWRENGPRRICEKLTNRVTLAANGKLLAAVSNEGDQTKVSLYHAAELTGNLSGSETANENAVAKTPTLPALNQTRIETPYVRGLAFNSNNGALAVLGENELLFLNARTGKTIGKAEPPTDGERRFVYPHPDPTVFFVADGLHFFKLIDARTGKVVREHNASHHFSSTARWSPDGKWLAYTHDQAGSIFSADLKHNDGLNEMDFKISESDRIASGVAFSSRGEFVAMIRVDGRILLFKNVAERKYEKQPHFQAHSERGTDIVFIGNELASIGAEGTVKFWKLGEEKPQRTISLGGKLADAKFLNDDTVAVVRDGADQLELHLLEANSDISKLTAVVPFNSDNHASGVDGLFERVINRVAVSHNGSTLVTAATVDDATEVSFYNLRKLKSLATAATPTKAAYRTWSTADGKYKIEAQLVSLTDGVAKLKRKDNGAVVDVPLTILTKADQAFAKAIAN